jgi:hypothetical protein
MSRIPIEPVIQPPVEGKTYDSLWLTSLVTITPYPGDENRIVLTWKPMAQDGSVLDDERRIESSSLMQAVAEVPALQQAFGAILGAIVPFQQWVDAQSQPIEPE